MAFENIGIVGGGAWGTALAQTSTCAGRAVTLWARETETAASINAKQENTLFLPGVPLDKNIRSTNDFADLANAQAILMVAPTQHVRSILQGLIPSLASGAPIILCAKGIEQKTGKFLSEVVEENVPSSPVAILSGPSFAADVAKNLPTAVTLACKDEDLGRTLAMTLGHKTFRPYWSGDIIGAQIGGAIKNVLAIASGIVVGKQLGESARAALVTRGFAELKRFGEAHGAKRDTLSGLSGLGDLILTCATAQSRNMALGQALGQGQSMQDYLAGKNSVAEGALTAPAVVAIAKNKKIEMPICEAVNAVISGHISVDDAIGALLARPFRAEE